MTEHPATSAARTPFGVDWHWDHQLRAQLDGLTDEEYLWEPVGGC